MRINQFLENYGLTDNPFAEEDAQTDVVFKDHCIESIYHPAWDKVYGSPSVPATSIVFGEKGAGKTALRLQIAKHLEQHNRGNPRDRVFVIHYDDFNPFLDRFRERFTGRRRAIDRVLAQWKLWDHIDAILSLGVTGLSDAILDTEGETQQVHCSVDPNDVASLGRHQSRDLLLLAACYDTPTSETFRSRWDRLKKRVKFRAWKPFLEYAGAIAISVPALILLIGLLIKSPPWFESGLGRYAVSTALIVAMFGVWIPWLIRWFRTWRMSGAILRRMRIGNHNATQLRKVLMKFTSSELAGQPLPDKDSTDDRYELLLKFQSLLKHFGYSGIVVLVDRLDEPHLINGSPELMKLLLWPMLDNKFLKHSGIGLKMMVPIELTRYVDREEKDFYERARLDKQNMVANFQWTGEALYDVMSARMKACAKSGLNPKVRDWFDESVTDQRLKDSFRSLRTPRHMFKFMYRLLVAHCNAHLDHEPSWKITTDVFEPTLALYLREQEAFDRGLGAG